MDEEVEPRLGEVLTKDEDGNYSVTLVDHTFREDDYTKTPNIRIAIVPDGAVSKKAHLSFEVTHKALEKPYQNYSPILQNEHLYRDQTTRVEDSISYMIYGVDLRVNDESDTRPTVYRIRAANKRGAVSATLTVRHVTLAIACTEYFAQHPEDKENSAVQLCRDWVEYKKQQDGLKEDQSKNEAPAATQEPDNPASDHSNGAGGSGHSSCAHFEQGRCWDEIEEQAADDAEWDRFFGEYGGSYNPPDGCTGICEDFYEDAYNDEYSDSYYGP